MEPNILSVREIQHSDIEFIINYWLDGEKSFLTGMGVDLNKIPPRGALFDMLSAQIKLPVEQKKSYCIIWLADNIPVGIQIQILLFLVNMALCICISGI